MLFFCKYVTFDKTHICGLDWWKWPNIVFPWLLFRIYIYWKKKLHNWLPLLLHFQISLRKYTNAALTPVAQYWPLCSLTPVTQYWLARFHFKNISEKLNYNFTRSFPRNILLYIASTFYPTFVFWHVRTVTFSLWKCCPAHLNQSSPDPALFNNFVRFMCDLICVRTILYGLYNICRSRLLGGRGRNEVITNSSLFHKVH